MPAASRPRRGGLDAVGGAGSRAGGGSTAGAGGRMRRSRVGSPCSHRCGSVMSCRLTSRPSAPHKARAAFHRALRSRPGRRLGSAATVDRMTDDPGFAHFLGEMARVPLLTAADERRLALRIERGDLAAKERMIAANLRLVVHIARSFQRADHGLALADLVQEGTFGLVRAVEQFDPRRGLRFSTYATIWIRQSISRSISDKGRAIRLPTSVEQRLLALRRAERALASTLGRDPTAAEAAAEL